MARLLFEKTGNAIWISHLDLMRLFQRSFKRAGLPLKHTQGYNPRPSVSIALPLSVGVESVCELLDFDLAGCDASDDQIMSQLNMALTEGVRVHKVYSGGRKLRDLSFLSCSVTLEYDNGVANNAVQSIDSLFQRQSLPVCKKSKNGLIEQDIIPMIKQLSISQDGANNVVIDAVICCQNPSMNPAQLAQAVAVYLPEIAPDHSSCRRIELFDGEMNVFR